MGERWGYTVRNIFVGPDAPHECTGRIVSVFQSSLNQETGKWYLTVLVERPHEGEVDDIP